MHKTAVVFPWKIVAGPLRVCLGLGLAMLLLACNESKKKEQARQDDPAAAGEQQAGATVGDTLRQDTLAVTGDSVPPFKTFLYRFRHSGMEAPVAITFRPGRYELHPGGGRRVREHYQMLPAFVHHYLREDSSREFHYILRLYHGAFNEADSSIESEDTLIRLVYADTVNFFLATFRRHDGKLLGKQRLTFTGTDSDGRPAQQVAYYWRDKGRFELHRQTAQAGDPRFASSTCTIVSNDEVICSGLNKAYNFADFKSQFPEETLSYKLDVSVKDIASIWNTAGQRLAAGYVKNFLDATYAPKYLIGRFFYIQVFLPQARVEFASGRVGLIVKEVTYSQTSTRHFYRMHLYDAQGKKLDEAKVASLDVKASMTVERSTIEDCQIHPDGRIVITRTKLVENIGSGKNKREVTEYVKQVTKDGQIERVAS